MLIDATENAKTLTVAAADAPNSVKKTSDFRCKGDNDDIVFQRAIDKAVSTDIQSLSNGGTVQLSKGIFNTSGTVTVKNGVGLIGDGVNSTRVNLTANVDMFSIEGGFTYIEKMKLFGNRDSGYTSNGIVNYAGFGDSVFRDIFVQDFGGDGMRIFHDGGSFLGTGWGWGLDNVVIEFCNGNGFYYESPGDLPKIRGCKFQANRKNGIYVANGKNLLITNSQLYPQETGVNDADNFGRFFPAVDISGWEVGDAVRDNDTGSKWTGVITDFYIRKNGQYNAIVTFDGAFTYSAVVEADGINNVTKSATSAITESDLFYYAGIRFETADSGIGNQRHSIDNCLFSLPLGVGVSAGYYVADVVVSSCIFKQGAIGIVAESGSANFAEYGNVFDGLTQKTSLSPTSSPLTLPISMSSASILQGWYTTTTYSERYDVPSLDHGTSHSVDVTVIGAEPQDWAEVGYEKDTQGISVTAQVTADDTVTVTFSNLTGGTLNLAAGYIAVKVSKK